MAAAEALELLRLHRAFDAFGHDAGFERPRERENAFNDRRALGKQETSDERPIDLQGIDRKLVQVAQRRVARSEIIKIDLYAEVPKLGKVVARHLGTRNKRSLGVLE